MPINRWVKVAVLCCVTTTLSWSSTAAAQSNTKDFVAFFDDLALSNIRPDSEKVVVKWQKPIHIANFYYSPTPPEVFDAITKVFEEAKEAGNINIAYSSKAFNTLLFFSSWGSETKDKDALALLKLFFASEEQAIEFIEDAQRKNLGCAYHATLSGNIISAAIILVDVSRTDTKGLVRCGARTAAAVLGIGLTSPDATRTFPSIANKESNTNELSEYDKEFLKIYDSDAIRAGMTESEVSKIVAKMVGIK